MSFITTCIHYQEMTNIDTFSYSDGLKCISFRGNVVSINISRLFEAFFCSHPSQTIEQKYIWQHPHKQWYSHPTTKLPWPGSYNKVSTNQVTLTSLFPMFLRMSKEADHFLRQFHFIHFTVIRLGPYIRLCFCLLTRPWPFWPLTPLFSEQVPIHAVLLDLPRPLLTWCWPLLCVESDIHLIR